MSPSAHGVLIEPATVQLQRVLPGPIEKVWAYLTESELRQQWLAAGDMQMQAGSAFEFLWRNDELTDPPGERPPGSSAEHRMQCQITECDPPRHLAFTWEGSGEVSFDLVPQGKDVLLTVVHRRLPRRSMLLGVSAGWHGHLDVLAARLTGATPAPFWDEMARLRADYDQRLPAEA